jgi:hypothetical protein
LAQENVFLKKVPDVSKQAKKVTLSKLVSQDYPKHEILVMTALSIFDEDVLSFYDEVVDSLT